MGQRHGKPMGTLMMRELACVLLPTATAKAHREAPHLEHQHSPQRLAQEAEPGALNQRGAARQQQPQLGARRQQADVRPPCMRTSTHHAVTIGEP